MLAGVLVLAGLALAGCTGTGNFDVQQTEPFRVQLEGSPQTVTVSDHDAEGKEVVVDTCNDPCDADVSSVLVKVNVVPQGACVIKVIVKDKSTGEVLEEREVDSGGSSGSASATTTSSGGNASTATTTSGGSTAGGDTTLVQNIVVNVKGGHNLVVLTQAVQGTADVQVSASQGSGTAVNNDGSSGSGTSMSSTGTGSTDSSTSASGTGTQSATATSTGP